jgi:general secretion pathway protein L
MTSLGQKATPVIAQRESLVRMSEQLTNLALLSRKSAPPLQTLKLITEALPDDTSLLSLQLQGQKVSISGQTGNAAALMKQLGSTPGLRDVKAPTPATKPLGAPRESFTIEFTLDPAQLKSAS